MDLSVEASDEGGRSSVALVRVTVTNHNDEAPRFLFLEYQTTVDETRTDLQPPITVRVSIAIGSFLDSSNSKRVLHNYEKSINVTFGTFMSVNV